MVWGAGALFCGLFFISTGYLAAELRQGQLEAAPRLETGAEVILQSPVDAGGSQPPADFYNDRGVLRFLDMDLEGAEADFRRAIEDRAEFVEPRLGLGAALARQERHLESLRACEEAARLSAPPAEAVRSIAGSIRGRRRLRLHHAALECCASERLRLGRPREAAAASEAARRMLVEEVNVLREISAPQRD